MHVANMSYSKWMPHELGHVCLVVNQVYMSSLVDVVACSGGCA